MLKKKGTKQRKRRWSLQGLKICAVENRLRRQKKQIQRGRDAEWRFVKIKSIWMISIQKVHFTINSVFKNGTSIRCLEARTRPSPFFFAVTVKHKVFPPSGFAKMMCCQTHFSNSSLITLFIIHPNSKSKCFWFRKSELFLSDRSGHVWVWLLNMGVVTGGCGYLKWVTCSSLGPKTPDYQKAL